MVDRSELIDYVYGLMTYVMTFVFVLMGALILIGGKQHLSSVGWDQANKVPGGYLTWGGSALALGLIGCFGLVRGQSGKGRKYCFACFSGASMWFFIVGMFFFISILKNPGGVYIGPLSWWLIAIFYAHRSLIFSGVLTVRNS